ncbi:hypothetical protein [Paramuribaculum intestinale]|nr:hypothetical protein [Paramuribaculum intestinale]
MRRHLFVKNPTAPILPAICLYRRNAGEVGTTPFCRSGYYS